MISELNFESSGLGSSPGQEHCVVFLGKILHSHSASLHPGVQMSTMNLMLGVTLRLTSISSRGKQRYSKLLLALEIVISLGLMGHLARMQTLYFSIHVFYIITIIDKTLRVL